jgi:hypothetical protein
MSYYYGVLTLSPPSFDCLRDRELVKTQSSLFPLVDSCNLPASFPLTVCIDEDDAATGENVAEDVEDRGRLPVDVDDCSSASRPAVGRGGGVCRFSSFL